MCFLKDSSREKNGIHKRKPLRPKISIIPPSPIIELNPNWKSWSLTTLEMCSEYYCEPWLPYSLIKFDFPLAWHAKFWTIHKQSIKYIIVNLGFHTPSLNLNFHLCGMQNFEQFINNRLSNWGDGNPPFVLNVPNSKGKYLLAKW